MLAQAKPPIYEKQRWQRARNKEYVSELVSDERDICMWLDEEAI